MLENFAPARATESACPLDPISINRARLLEIFHMLEYRPKDAGSFADVLNELRPRSLNDLPRGYVTCWATSTVDDRGYITVNASTHDLLEVSVAAVRAAIVTEMKRAPRPPRLPMAPPQSQFKPALRRRKTECDCIICHEAFLSTGPGHRMCGRCRSLSGDHIYSIHGAKK